jgi:ferredoxin--NADP+ reductase
MDRPLRVAVVGSGPSGMYAAADLIAQERATVDVFDRLPVPFGLVRYGVAPDHFSIRSIRDTLDKIWDEPGIRFLGNVTVGTDIQIAELRQAYDAVILTYGASADRTLGIPGESLTGCVGATDFVAWYCGHPDANRAFFESYLPTVTHAAVVGLGNVAVDVARILAKTPEELHSTDMPAHVRATLAAMSLTDIHIVGRRGPAQATWTTKELRELGELENCSVEVDQIGLGSDAAWETDQRVALRNVEVVRSWMQRAGASGRKLHLHFLTRPVAVAGTDQISILQVERTEFTATGGLAGTGEVIDLPIEFLVRSIGYRGTGLPGVPFDDASGTVVQNLGRIEPGLYAAGWIKRGPSGIIGTNKKDAAETVASLLSDADSGSLSLGDGSIDELLAARNIETVSINGWRAIDRAERTLGAGFGIERMTISDHSSMIEISTLG